MTTKALSGRQVLEERLDASETAASQYVWGARYIDDLVLRDRDATGGGVLDERLYALQDANWNVIAISNPDGQMQERYAYDAYGSPAVHDGAFTPIPSTAHAWPYTYTGRRLDEESGLMYYRNRMYHPELGRFVSRDPIHYAGRDVSLYRYALGRPTMFRDPLGLAIWNHHWFPQNETHLERFKALCGKIFELLNIDVREFIDFVTTEFEPGWGPKRSPHKWLHHDNPRGKYLDQVDEAYKSPDCCELMKRMKSLVVQNMEDVLREFTLPAGAHGPELYPQMVRWRRDGGLEKTSIWFDGLIDWVCNPPCPPRRMPDYQPHRFPEPVRVPNVVREPWPLPEFRPGPIAVGAGILIIVVAGGVTIVSAGGATPGTAPAGAAGVGILLVGLGVGLDADDGVW